jgi:hypothetical protein
MAPRFSSVTTIQSLDSRHALNDDMTDQSDGNLTD